MNTTEYKYLLVQTIWVILIQRRKWQPTPVFLPEESHGQGSLAGYSPWSLKELDTTEVTLHACIHILMGTNFISQLDP